MTKEKRTAGLCSLHPFAERPVFNARKPHRMPKSDPGYDQCSESSGDLVALYRATINDQDHHCSLAVVHYRGGQTEFDVGLLYALSPDPLDRIAGADVLAQLGWGDGSFLSESVAVLISLLSDSDERVISAAAVGLGHRNDPSAIPEIFKVICHRSAEVRFGAVLALSRHEDESAIAGLIKLSQDADGHVRDWATVGLGSQTEMDIPELRDALARNIADPDPEIRGEAMIGLARRRDARAYPAIVTELSGEFHGSWCLEAAELLADQRLLPLLRSLRTSISDEERVAFSSDFESAELACGSTPKDEA